MTLADRIAEIEARADAATKGPWQAYLGRSIDQLTDGGHGYPMNVYSDSATIVAQGEWESLPPGFQHENDALFCAAARSDVPALCAALKVACEAIERLDGNHHPDLPYGRDDVAEAALASIERIMQKMKKVKP
jgi:hypothetical protein